MHTLPVKQVDRIVATNYFFAITNLCLTTDLVFIIGKECRTIAQ